MGKVLGREETQLFSGDRSPGLVIVSCERRKAHTEGLPRLAPLPPFLVLPPASEIACCFLWLNLYGYSLLSGKARAKEGWKYSTFTRAEVVDTSLMPAVSVCTHE